VGVTELTKGDQMSVWVAGATGKAGKRIVEALSAAGMQVRAASRHPDEPAGGVTPVRFDWYDPTTWQPALGDADVLFLKGLDSDHTAGEIVARFISCAPAVRHVVLLSQVGVEHTPPQNPRRALELAVENSGKDWTILRSNWFMQNFDEDEWVYAKALRERGMLYASSGASVVSFVDTRDIADAAVAVSSRDGHHGQGYTLTGPAALTFGRVAQVLSRASGRPVRHIDATLDEHREHFARSGRSDAWVDHMMHLFALIRAGVFAPVSDDVKRLTGNPPRTFEQYADQTWTG
jgi:uncharacterized protein YbjT (DUF2867 family)